MFKLTYNVNKWKLEQGGRYCIWSLSAEQTELKIDATYIITQFDTYSDPGRLSFASNYQYVIVIERETESGWKEIFSSVFPVISFEQTKLTEAFIQKYLERNYKKPNGDII